MHETAIATGIIKEAKKHGDVEAIHLEIGELAHVPAEDLLECLKRLVPWKISSVIDKAHCECTCGFQGHPDILDRGHDFFYIECPDCGNVPNLKKGTEIKILNVVVR